MTLEQLKDLQAKMTQGEWNKEVIRITNPNRANNIDAIAALPDILDSYIALLERIEGMEKAIGKEIPAWASAAPDLYPEAFYIHNSAISAVKNYLKGV